MKGSQARDLNAGSGGSSIGGPETFFDTAGVNQSIQAQYVSSSAGNAVTIDAFFPRVTGVLMP